MKKFLTGNAVLNLIIGLGFIVGFLVVFFLTDWLEQFVDIVIATLIVVFSSLRYFKDYKNKKSENILLILTGEYAIALLLAALLIFETLSVDVALGLVLALRGFTYMLIMQLLNKRSSFEDFLIYMGILILGTYVLFSGFPLNSYERSIVLLAVGLVIGVFYATAGIQQLQK